MLIQLPINAKRHCAWLVLLLCLFMIGCDKQEGLPDKNSTYYWRTEWRLDTVETSFLLQYHIKKVYFRYFDVVMRDSVPMPNATIRFTDQVPQD